MNTHRRTDHAEEVRAIRALAHPLRLRLLDLLRFDGPSTATLLAARLDESSGATSFHLRSLARYGYIEEAPRPGSGARERWWRYRERAVTLPAERAGDLGERGLLAEVLSREAHALDRYLAARGQYARWDESAFFRTAALRLTPDEFERLRAALMALVDAARRADAAEPPEDAAPVRLLLFGFPQVLEDT